jgi:hypothetical protein
MSTNINKLSSILISVIAILCLNSCTVYTEKQSEALSQTVHATKDSIDVGRIDLADKYIDEASRIVKPPKKRIEVKAIFKRTIDTLASNNKKTPIYNEVKQRVVIIPERYKGDTVVVVSSDEYKQLLKDKEVYRQLEADFKNLQDTKLIVDGELMKQMEYRDKMIRDLNIMQKKLVEKDLAILQRNVIIVILASVIGVMVYLRFKGGVLF